MAIMWKALFQKVICDHKVWMVYLMVLAKELYQMMMFKLRLGRCW